MQRRQFLATGGLACASAMTMPLEASQGPGQLDLIDCHTHFYDPSRPQGVPWPDKSSSLYRTVLPEDLLALPMDRPLTGTVVVEASEWFEDNAWLLDLAAKHPFVVGVVGRLEPDSPTFDRDITHLAKNPLYRGIRAWSPKVAKLLESDALGAFRRMLELDLALDLNGGPETPELAHALAKRLPELKIVLNHIGNVAITGSPPPAAWAQAIALAATSPNLYCKISALVEGASRDGRRAPTDLAFYRPTIDVVWDAFGDQRVIYGSNWPVCESGADYQTVQRLVLTFAFEKGEDATRRYCSLNAKRAYGWIERPGRPKPG